jgi:PadR family transcriptional regulator PadR
MQDIAECSGFQRDLLIVVDDLDEPNGREVEAELAAVYGELRSSRVYQNLSTLEDGGFVAVDVGEKRVENCYSLSGRGSGAVRAYRRFVSGEGR